MMALETLIPQTERSAAA
jgi:hypothetical protein